MGESLSRAARLVPSQQVRRVKVTRVPGQCGNGASVIMEETHEAAQHASQRPLAQLLEDKVSHLRFLVQFGLPAVIALHLGLLQTSEETHCEMREGGRKGGRTDGRTDGRTEGQTEIRKEGRKEGRKGRKEERKGRREGRQEGRKEGRKEGGKEGRKEERKKGRKEGSIYHKRDRLIGPRDDRKNGKLIG